MKKPKFYKPRLFKNSWGLWFCCSPQGLGAGETVSEAYHKWAESYTFNLRTAPKKKGFWKWLSDLF